MHSTKQELNYNRSDILDVEAASILLGYTVGSLYQLTSKRLIPFFKVPGLRKVYFSRKELERWIFDESNRITTSQDLALLAINRSQN
jgi:hypothetical protein